MDDYYITKRRVREERKLLAEEGIEVMGDIFDLVKDGGDVMNSRASGSELNNLIKSHSRIVSNSKIQNKNSNPSENRSQRQGESPRLHHKNSYPGQARTFETTTEINIPEAYDEEEEDSAL